MNEISRENIVAEPLGRTEAPTFIAVTFWGEEYRRYFIDYCLASLMAPGNIPAIRNKSDARLLIATTDADWQALQAEPIVIAAKQHIGIEHIRHDAPVNTPYNKKMMVMSQGHRLLTKRMFEAGARGIMAYPDGIFADGAIRRIEELARDGWKVVLVIAVRFANEGLNKELLDRGFMQPGTPLVVDAEELARLTVRHLHSETVRLEFDADIDDQGACAFFWVVAPGQDLLFHSANWAAVLIDYSSLRSHDDTTFDKWTFDGDYVAKNFPNPDDVYVVRNTKELFLSGFTAESKLTFRKLPFYPYRFPSLRRILKMIRAREFMVSLKVLDDVKKVHYRIPIRVQGGTSSEADWSNVESRAAAVIDRISDPSAMMTFGCICWGIARRPISLARRVQRKLREQPSRTSVVR